MSSRRSHCPSRVQWQVRERVQARAASWAFTRRSVNGGLMVCCDREFMADRNTVNIGVRRAVQSGHWVPPAAAPGVPAPGCMYMGARLHLLPTCCLLQMKSYPERPYPHPLPVSNAVPLMQTLLLAERCLCAAVTPETTAAAGAQWMCRLCLCDQWRRPVQEQRMAQVAVAVPALCSPPATCRRWRRGHSCQRAMMWTCQAVPQVRPAPEQSGCSWHAGCTWAGLQT